MVLRWITIVSNLLYSYTIFYCRHYGSVVVLEWIAQEHSAVQEGGGGETADFGGGGGKGGDLKGI